MIDEQDPVQVIDLMLERPGQQLVSLDLDGFSLGVETANRDTRRSRDHVFHVGNAQAALRSLVLFVAGLDDDRIDEDPASGLRVVFVTQVQHTHTQGNTDLGGRQPDPLREVHRLLHVSDQRAEFVVERLHLHTRLSKNFFAEQHDPANRH